MELTENLQYGNSPGIDLHYSYAAILVKVPPSSEELRRKQVAYSWGFFLREGACSGPVSRMWKDGFMWLEPRNYREWEDPERLGAANFGH
jgi:hypothetical protein